LHSGIERTPETSVGFQPTFDDRRVHRVDTFTDAEQVAPEVGQANRVFVYYAEHPFSSTEGDLRTQLASTLSSLGLELQQTKTFDDATVQVWVRPGSPQLANLQAGDLPPGWSLIPLSSSPGQQVFACAGAEPSGATRSAVLATKDHDLAISELDRWPSRGAAPQAVAGLRPPKGASCARAGAMSALLPVSTPVPIGITVRASRT